ncbi:hypothetical protein PF010_g5091 [Phytophthora fragariae]|uniref:Uncharacterized protein n=1 Tax=Phytophthora fragariae TaxID=53985 RepID=A0A6G0LPC6_9STRA|nr:hypothetical protein PF010_g5091 [Phytophthora fragariae]
MRLAMSPSASLWSAPSPSLVSSSLSPSLFARRGTARPVLCRQCATVLASVEDHSS